MLKFLIFSFVHSKIYLGEDLHWDGTRLDNRDDGIVEHPSVYQNEVLTKIKVEPTLAELDSYIWINHLYSAPLNNTHHYFFESEDCMILQFEASEDIFPYELDLCFNGYQCKVIGLNKVLVTAIKDIPMLRGKMGKIKNP